MDQQNPNPENQNNIETLPFDNVAPQKQNSFNPGGNPVQQTTQPQGVNPTQPQQEFNPTNTQSQPNEIPPTNTFQTGANPVQQMGGFNQPQQNMGFNPQPQQNFNNQQQGFGNQQQPKYKIIDMYWLLNPKLENNQIDQYEAHFVSIAYNINFGNLKVSFFQIGQGSINGHVVFQNKMQRLCTGTVYNSSCLRVLNLKENESCIAIEQLWSDTGENWQHQRPECSFMCAKEIIRLQIKDPANGTFYYDFNGWQKEALLNSCKFALSEGSLLVGMNKVNS